MIQHWDLANIGNLPSVGYLIHKGILTLPLVVLAIIFIGSLSPMTIYYRQTKKIPLLPNIEHCVLCAMLFSPRRSYHFLHYFF